MSEHIQSGAEVLPPRPKTAIEKAAALAALSEEGKRATRCCFTGHRPEELRRPVDDLKVDLENEIVKTVQDGYNTFITGMAPRYRPLGRMHRPPAERPLPGYQAHCRRSLSGISGAMER